ncbi:hypothetical protein ACPPVO_50415 [Dactylosporangium sp. McL0621]|uniref:hypothetical protein n=1 Tax=Dactylosporangium sp. McL0621 TaxID=3415678 RepID=UPI003CEB61BC
MEPDHWAPNSQSKAGPAVVTLAVLTAVAWLALGLDGLVYRDSLDEPEGMATGAAAFMGLLGSVVTLVLTVVTALVAAYHRAVSEQRWALVVAVSSAVLAVGLCGWWTVVAIRQ